MPRNRLYSLIHRRRGHNLDTPEADPDPLMWVGTGLGFNIQVRRSEYLEFWRRQARRRRS